MPNGGWPWFEGMRDSRYITQHIVTGFGHLDHLGVSGFRENRSAWNMVNKSVLYLDDRMREDYEYIRENYPEQFIIADAKRGDIGNTSHMYAHAFFKTLDCDAITLSPYMGFDSISPFLEVDGKWAILLALTSNQGSADFQQLTLQNEKQLFEQVITTSASWGTVNNIMYVVGATKTEALTQIRKLIPEHFLLVPGVGSQGGSLEEVAAAGMNDRCGLLVNASRSIIYADVTNKFEHAAREEASRLQKQMETILAAKKLI